MVLAGSVPVLPAHTGWLYGVVCMTNGQIAQLQDLSKCYVSLEAKGVLYWFSIWDVDSSFKLMKNEKALLRKYTHQYRHQIAAIKRNQKAARSSDAYLMMLMSERVLARDWNRPEEDEAWKSP